jgi:hypothetical protein
LFLQVDVFFSRDLDSRISGREVAAVQQFLSSDKTVSIKTRKTFEGNVHYIHVKKISDMAPTILEMLTLIKAPNMVMTSLS